MSDIFARSQTPEIPGLTGRSTGISGNAPKKPRVFLVKNTMKKVNSRSLVGK